MNKISTYLLCISLFFLYSCGTNTEEKIEFESIAFDVGFKNNPTLQGIYCDKNTQIEEVFFVKDSISPRILFFETQSGSLSDSINLNAIATIIGRISKVSILNKDSIILMSTNSNRIIGIDRECNIHFNHDLKKLLHSNGNIYSFHPSMLPTAVHNNHSIILGTTWKGNKEKKTYKTPYDEYIDCYRNYCHSAQLCKIDSIYNKHPTITWGLKEYYINQISATVKPYFEYNTLYYLFNDQIIYANYYDKNIHRLNVETLEIEESKLMIPKTLNLLSSIKFKGEIDPEDALLELQNRKNSDYVCNILYSNDYKEYYIFIKTGIDNSTTDELGYTFSIMTYSNHFDFIKELKIDSTDLLPQGALLSNKGILIETLNSESENGVRVFCVIDNKSKVELEDNK